MKSIAATFALLAAGIAAPPAPAQHTVSLNWIASTDAAANPSLTYNVYRSTTCAGAFAKLNASPVSATNYSDSAVLPGSYCYQVTSVLSGAESSPSNQAVALIPSSLQQPNRCVHRGKLLDWLRCVQASPQPAKKAKTAP